MSPVAVVQTLDNIRRTHEVPTRTSVRVKEDGLLIVTTETGGTMYAPGQWVLVDVEDTCPG